MYDSKAYADTAFILCLSHGFWFAVLTEVIYYLGYMYGGRGIIGCFAHILRPRTLSCVEP